MAAYNPAIASFSTTAFTYSPLLSDGDDVTSRSGTIASGAGILKRGTICKIVPATGVITIGATAAEANCVLADDVDATSATKAALVYLTGRFKADALIWPGALAHADVADALRNYGIIVESVVFTDGTLVKSVPTAEEAANAQAALDKARAALEAATTTPATPPPPDPNAPKPSDSLWAYMTAEERALHPELANPPAPEPATPPATPPPTTP